MMKFRCYGVEKEPDTVKLAKMNLLLNNIRGEITEANSFYSDPYNSFGQFDYVMANPPFNVDEVVFDRVAGDARFNTYGVPRNKTKSTRKEGDKKETVPNANYLWIGLFATALNATGKAALVMANSASDAGGSENEDYYEKLLQLVEDLKREQSRSTDMGLTEEEMEIYDLLSSGKKLTRTEEQKVILAAKNLYKKLLEEKDKVMVVDWYKDEQPRHQVLALIQTSLNDDLPQSYDKASFTDKTRLLFNHFVDMAVQGYGWIA